MRERERLHIVLLPCFFLHHVSGYLKKKKERKKAYDILQIWNFDQLFASLLWEKEELASESRLEGKKCGRKMKLKQYRKQVSFLHQGLGGISVIHCMSVYLIYYSLTHTHLMLCCQYSLWHKQGKNTRQVPAPR